MIDVTHFTDPGCPWAYSAWPALTTLRWRYGDGLHWKLVMIGLAEDSARYARAGYTPAKSAVGQLRFRRFGMPLNPAPKARLHATSPACRAIVAVRLHAPELGDVALRALQFAHFTTSALLDDPRTLRAALSGVDGLDADAVVDRIDAPEVWEAYEADRAAARTAEGSPTEAQGRAANSDGAVRYTAPSLVFSNGSGVRLEAGGFQPIEGYDVVIANLDPGLARRAPADDPVSVLHAFPYPLATAEVAAVMTEHLGVPDLARAEELLVAAAGSGQVVRHAAGDSALWSPA
ncbi:MAG TPA: DsbA family protein [Solirubrobacteraceae bacterium]|nr:DsbA family protein [Solirubrobacteraceae bacterium]